MIKNTEFESFMQKKINDDNITEYNLIGLMTSWLLDKGYDLSKDIDVYQVCNSCFIEYENTSLYDCLITAINKIGEV